MDRYCEHSTFNTSRKFQFDKFLIENFPKVPKNYPNLYIFAGLSQITNISHKIFNIRPNDTITWTGVCKSVSVLSKRFCLPGKNECLILNRFGNENVPNESNGRLTLGLKGKEIECSFLPWHLREFFFSTKEPRSIASCWAHDAEGREIIEGNRWISSVPYAAAIGALYFTTKAVSQIYKKTSEPKRVLLDSFKAAALLGLACGSYVYDSKYVRV